MRPETGIVCMNTESAWQKDRRVVFAPHFPASTCKKGLYKTSNREIVHDIIHRWQYGKAIVPEPGQSHLIIEVSKPGQYSLGFQTK